MTYSSSANQSNVNPLLPELKGEPQLQLPETPGEWREMDAHLRLGALSNDILIPELRQTKRSIDSIPDIWARLIVFRMALFNRDHPLHHKIKAEWRALIALIALKERRNIRLFSRRCLLTDRTVPFFRRASEFFPLESVASDIPRDQVHLIYYGDEDLPRRTQVLGVTSPSTLVCTASHLEDKGDRFLQWITQGKFSNVPSLLVPEERQALASWLIHLRNRLRTRPETTQGNITEQLLKQIRLFLEDLVGEDEPQYSPKLANTELGINLGTYQLLNNPLEGVSVTTHRSAVALVPSEGLSPETTLLLLDPDLPEKWGITNPDEYPVYGTETLASVDYDNLGNDPKRLGNHGRGHILEGAEWRRPKDLFTDYILLTLFSNYKAFPGTVELKGQSNLRLDDSYAVPILPIKPELLDYYTPDELVERISIRQGSDNRIIVDLDLTVRGIGDSPRSVKISKTYSADSMTLRASDSLPVVEIWPNFQTPDWRYYLTYYNSNGVREYESFYAQPHIAPGSESFHKRVDSIEGIREITRSERPPSALICHTLLQKQKISVCVGIFLIKELPYIEPVAGRKWDIGVDFGTSSSFVYARISSGTKPFPVTFKERLYQITPAATDYRNNIKDYFLPPFDHENPFLTLFRPEISQGDEERREPLIRGNIRYVEPGAILKPSDIINVKSRFKWSDDPKLVSGFLEQIALQVLAEAASDGVTGVQWYASWPIVFSYAARKVLSNAWKRIKDLTSLTGLTAGNAKYKTESVALALYFKEVEKANLRGTICIDIGGGTSDISIWGQSESPLLQSSIKFAGEDFFMNIIKSKPDVLSKLFPGTNGQEQLATLDPTDDERFYPGLDSLLKEKRDIIKEELADAVQIEGLEGDLHRLIHLIGLGVSGLVFYSGLLLNSLRRVLDRPSKERDDLPSLCIGGNGSRTLSWLGLGEFGEEDEYYRLFKQLLATAMELDRDYSGNGFDVFVSTQPKAEVAYGLIVPTQTNLKADPEDEPDFVVAGEDFLSRKGPKESRDVIAYDDGYPEMEEVMLRRDWNSELTVEMLSDGVEVVSDLDQLSIFVDAFNSHAAKRGNGLAFQIDLDKHRKRIVEHVQDVLSNYKGQTPSSITIEPLFITALKHLLVLETRKWLE